MNKLRLLSFQFDRDVDSCSKPEHKPVLNVRIKTGSLWPVVVIEKVRVGVGDSASSILITKVQSSLKHLEHLITSSLQSEINPSANQ